MMKNRLTIIAIALTFGAQNLKALNADSLVYEYYANDQWFELRQLVKEHADEMDSDNRLLAEALVATAFQERYAEKKLKKAIQNFDSYNTKMYLAYNLADIFHRNGNDKKAAKWLEKAMLAIGDSIDSESKEGYECQLVSYKLQDDEGKMTADERYGELEIPFELEEVGEDDWKSKLMKMYGEANGKPISMIFDTGSAVNMMTTEMAKKIGLYIKEVKINLKGVEKTTGKMTFVDNLAIGNMNLHHVPFIVTDLDYENIEDKSFLKSKQILMGLPLMTFIGKMDIDIKKCRIFSSEREFKDSLSNLCYDNVNYGLRMQGNINGKKFTFIPDTGALTTVMNKMDFTQWWNDSIETNPDLKLWGIGGVNKDEIGTINLVPIKIGENKATLKKVILSESNLPENVLGMDFWSQFHHVYIDLKSMYITVE